MPLAQPLPSVGTFHAPPLGVVAQSSFVGAAIPLKHRKAAQGQKGQHRVVCLRKPGRTGRPGQGGDSERDQEGRKEKEVRQPYLIKVVTPPQRDLGLHCLPQNTQCGETVDIEGEDYIVSGVTYTYRLTKGRYIPGEKRLDVQSCGRYLVNLYLDDLLYKS